MDKPTIEEYLINKNDKYLFHGSVKELELLKPMQANDSNGDKINIDNAIFLLNKFLNAIPYAFKDTIKENSKGLNWSFSIPNEDNNTKMIMKNVRIDKSIEGYIYVFERTNDMFNEPKGSTQWKCYKELKPLRVLKVKYKNYYNYFKVENDMDSLLNKSM